MSRLAELAADPRRSFQLVTASGVVTLEQIRREVDAVELRWNQDCVLLLSDAPAAVVGLLCAAEHARVPVMVGPAAASAEAVAELLGRQLQPHPQWPGAWRLHPWPEEEREQVLLMTSGTTGRPKVVRHCLDSLLARVRVADSSGAWLLTYPVSAFAGMQVVLTALLSQAKLVVAPSGTAEEVISAAIAHGVTHISATPTFWRRWILHGDAGRRVPLQQITIGGEAVDQNTLDHLRALYPDARVTHIYASTEAGSLFSVSDGREGFPAAWLQTGIEGVRLRVRDGVLEVNSPRRMAGYASPDNDPATGDGFLGTGDLVVERGDRVIFCGRADRVINVAGYKVSAEEVESILLPVEGVSDIRVYGQSNVITGNVVMAEVVCGRGFSPDAVVERLRQHARAKLRKFQVPAQIRVVEALALSASGKKERA